ncbi:MAG: hypothetical protein M3Y24_10765 [Acidobacteriota bacterium]|nr:hypothetical protein [Acidobacteriota bacterium]
MIAQTRRIVAPRDRDRDPELDPVFINHTQVMIAGEDVFLDFGVIKPSDIVSLPAGESDHPPLIDFYLLQRIVMSKVTLGEFLKQVVGLHQAMAQKTPEQVQKENLPHER